MSILYNLRQRQVLQSKTKVYDKVWQALQSMKDYYYKVPQLLHSMTVTTKWDATVNLEIF